MKQYLFIFFTWFSALLCYAQEPYDEKNWDIPDSLPEFPGGHASLLNYIDENLVYPLEFLELVLLKGVRSNKVWVEFIIEKDGRIPFPSIKKDDINCMNCRKEAVSVMKLSPQWKPGCITIETRDKYDQSLTSWELKEPIGYIDDSIPPKKTENKGPLLAVRTVTVLPIYFKLEKLPELPYGIDSLNHYISTNLIYPERAINEKIQGKVDVKLMFDDTGELKDVILLQGMENCPECDEEALILLRNMPKDLMRANDSPNSPKPFFFNTFIEFRLE